MRNVFHLASNQMIPEPFGPQPEQIFHSSLDAFEKTIPETDIRLDLAVGVDVPELSRVGIGQTCVAELG
jgi:hypothetical protein